MKLAGVVVLAFSLSSCAVTQYGPDAPAKNADATCAAKHDRKSQAYYACYSKEIAVLTPTNIGSGIDSVAKIQNGTAPPRSCASSRDGTVTWCN